MSDRPDATIPAAPSAPVDGPGEAQAHGELFGWPQLAPVTSCEHLSHAAAIAETAAVGDARLREVAASLRAHAATLTAQAR